MHVQALTVLENYFRFSYLNETLAALRCMQTALHEYEKLAPNIAHTHARQVFQDLKQRSKEPFSSLVELETFASSVVSQASALLKAVDEWAT